MSGEELVDEPIEDDVDETLENENDGDENENGENEDENNDNEHTDNEDKEGKENVNKNNENENKENEEEVHAEPLTAEIISSSLSLLCKIGTGLAHAYVKLNISKRELGDISILESFIYLRYLDISENKIRDISPINHLTHLLTLKADKNLLKSGLLNKLPYLQHIDFSNNQIKDLFGINHPLLEKLNLNGNEVLEISSFDAANLSYLAVLELRGNKLTSTKCTYPQSLKMLYLAENAIEEIQDVSQLTHLKTLHLRNNKITNLNGFSENMKNLQYLNLRMNNISELHEINKLKCLPMLRALILIDNPICYEESYRIEVLVILRRLERLDHDVYVDEERKDAEEIYNERNSIEKAENVITE
ncbi:leucine-rich repeat-containing protein 23 isoform X1 [Hydra vulgaris]|uniref:leucine-rich repeat-containing protein 23 isoform X1 n=1 Tax=Hydra vulgaris TaxID=6087 RepID=UPI0032EA82E2